VRQKFGLALSRGPLFGLVARLVHQKGVDLVLSAADAIVAAGGQIVVTGRGETQFEEALVEAHRRRPDAIGVDIGFDDGDARRIFAGSDFTLMPSRFEPCGLSQMYGAAVRLVADRAPDRRTRGNHRGWRNRFPVHTSLNRVVSRRHPARIRNFRSEGSLRLDAPERNGAVIQLGRFRSLLRRAIPEGCIPLAHAYAGVYLCVPKISRQRNWGYGIG
jgi:hypothetical protein